MKHGFGRTLAAAAAVLTLALAGCGSGSGGGGSQSEADYTRDLTFGTGGTAGVYFPLGNEYARILESNVDGLSVNAIETDGSVDNVGRISRNELELALIQSNTVNEAVTGTGQFADVDEPVENLGWIGQLYPESVQVVTVDGSGVASMDDLKGKRIGVGSPGSGTRSVAEMVLSAHGIEEGDYEPYSQTFADSRSLLQDGNLDASIETIGVPAASLTELAATTDVKLIPLDEGVAQEIADGSYFETYTIPGGTYEFVPEDVPTVTMYATAIASTSRVSEDDGYAIAKTIYEKAGDITLAQGEMISLDDALLGRGDVPLHPGAEKYFTEEGLLD
ncbi:TAXI family TRAP transporter solute-binding subunit [Brevibacterium luteolum]|uniref:TAXI family TRAP transporter solute-binding subunit n=1 Tax=Brevibacterium luteolum TaxID=199591 RepID=UPI00158486BC|nr:TAXI family TRAP transporter solute-binding subunit [Brevibacterium luteolum]